MASKNTPTAIMSGAGWLMQFGSGVSNGLLARGYDNDRIHALVTDGGRVDLERGIEAFVTAVAGPSVPMFDPATGTFRWEVNYDETIAAKIAVKDPSLAWATDYATDQKFPDDRTGKRIVTGRIWFPNCYLKQNGSTRDAPGILARPKELIDFSKAFPCPALDSDMPLAAPGQFWTDAYGRRHCLYLDRHGASRDLNCVWLHPFEEWGDLWRFLVLDK